MTRTRALKAGGVVLAVVVTAFVAVGVVTYNSTSHKLAMRANSTAYAECASGTGGALTSPRVSRSSHIRLALTAGNVWHETGLPI